MVPSRRTVMRFWGQNPLRRSAGVAKLVGTALALLAMARCSKATDQLPVAREKNEEMRLIEFNFVSLGIGLVLALALYGSVRSILDGVSSR